MENIKKIAKRLIKKDFVLAIFLLVISDSFIFVNQARAAWWDSASDAISTVMMLLSEFIAYFIGVFIMLASWLDQWALQLNASISTSSVVKIGINITLSLANLGFVTILIIIALATILRRESYGAKNLLAKLIIAALLVNFSLPISSTLLQISDQFTYYFLSAFPGTKDSPGGIDGFSNAIAVAFNPQGVGVTLSNEAASNAQEANASPTVGSSAFISIMSLGFTIIFPLIILIALLGLFVMLLIRYVYLGILLILMPLAWIAWITPLTEKEWQKWWDEFLKWTFFSPILMLFLYIAMREVHDIATINGDNNLGVALALKGITPSFMQIIGEQIILIGLVIGGLIAANSMGIKAAAATISTAKSAGKSIGNYARKQGVRASTSPLRSKWGQSAVGALSRSRIPGITAIGRGLASVSEKGGKNLVDEAAKGADKHGLDTLQNNINGRGSFLSPHELMGELQSYMKRGGDVSKINPDIFKNVKMFENFGQSQLRKEGLEKLGVNDEILGAREDLAKAQKSGDPDKISSAKVNLQDATDKYVSSLSQKGVAEMPNNLILPFNKEKSQGMTKEVFDVQQQAYITATVKENPRAALSKIKDLAPAQFKYATNLMVKYSLPEDILKKEQANIDKALSKEATNSDKEHLEEILKNYSPKFHQEISGKSYRRLMSFLPLSQSGTTKAAASRIGKNPPRKEPPADVNFASQT
jgi:hypothetical protein